MRVQAYLDKKHQKEQESINAKQIRDNDIEMRRIEKKMREKSIEK